MAMIIRPADALVNRLIQQQKNEPTPSKAAHHSSGGKDMVNISSVARQQAEPLAEPGVYSSFGYAQQELESQLLHLYDHGQHHGADD